MTKPSPQVATYIAGLPEPRRSAIAAVRDVVLANLPAGYEESAEFGMLSYQVPLRVYPETYNKRPLMYAALASQKSHMALYMCNANGIEKVRRALEAGFKKAGKKLDMGKSCLRFQALEDLPLDVVGKAIAATPMKAYIAFDRSLRSADAVQARSASRKKASAAAGKSKAPPTGRRAK